MSSMHFSRPKWRPSDFHVRRAAVEKLTDQALLAEIARNDKDSWVREVAVNKMSDEVLLRELAQNSSDIYVRKNALKKIGDKTLFSASRARNIK